MRFTRSEYELGIPRGFISCYPKHVRVPPLTKPIDKLQINERISIKAH